MRTIKKIYHGIVFLLVMLLFFASFPIANLIYSRKRIWLISEVDFDARDNGYHFFKYLNEKHPEIYSVYIISKKNPSYHLIESIGKSVEPFSYKHMLFFIAAKAKISTLVHGCSPSWCVTKFLLKHHGTGKNIALKHGIFKNVHPNYFKCNAHLDLICCGAEPEYKFIDSEFGYNSGVAQYTGLARFDELHDFHAKNEILIMPTWRRWLDNINDSSEFVKTDYYLNWISFLKNPLFLKVIKENNVKVSFYLHPKLNRFRNIFNDLDDDITFLNSKNGDNVQAHLKSASILITDFSSVFFDFAYMKKPVVFYQFDEKRYFELHYKKAYFDYRNDGFGPVVVKTEDLVSEVYKIILNKNAMSGDFLARAESFFPLNDNKNCERIYSAIKVVLSR